MPDFLAFPWYAAGLAVVGVVAAVWGGRVVVCEAHGWRWRQSLVALTVRFPHTASMDDVAAWVGALRTLLPEVGRWGLPWPICVEVTGTGDGITHVAWVPRRLHGDVLAAVRAALPGARFDEVLTGRNTRDVVGIRGAAEARSAGAAELLAVDRGLETSRRLLAALQPLKRGEVVRVQWLLTGAHAPRWITRPETELTAIPELWKSGQPMFRAVCRIVVATGEGRRRARSLRAGVWAALQHMNTPRTRVARRWLTPGFVTAGRVVYRVLPRGHWPLLLGATELGALLGLVWGESPMPGVPDAISRTLSPSPTMPTSGLVVAASNYPGGQATLRLQKSDRLRHMWVLGPTGAGKSTLLANMASYDIAHGDGLVVVDPRGDLVTDICDHVPADRTDDVIVIDPTADDYAVGVNPLQAGPPEQAAGFTYHVLQSIYAGSWGPRTADIVRASLLTLTHTTAPDGGAFTLLEVPELLTNPGFRRAVLAQPGVSDQLQRFWRWFNNLSEPHQASICAPVLNKLRVFTLSTSLRGLLGQSDGVRFADVLAHKRIVLVALKKGLLGDEASALIGSLVISSVWQATLARANMPKHERSPFWLMVDEFQDVLKLPLDLADMLAQARGLGLGATLGHQYMHQLGTELKAAVLGTTRTHLVFQLGDDDAHDLANLFMPLTADDLANLGPYEIAVRPCVGGATLRPVTGRTYPQPEPIRDGAALAAASRRHHGHPITDVDEQIADRTTVAPTRGTRWNRIPSGDDQ